MRALEEARAQERAQKEAEERTQADATKREACKIPQRKVAEQKARTQTEIRAQATEKARCGRSVSRRLPSPTRKRRGVPLRLLLQLCRRPRGRSSGRRPREGHAWTSFEGISKGTLSQR